MSGLALEAYDGPGPLPEDFVELPYRLRAHEPAWVPPPRAELRRLLSAANPYFRHARCRHFLCRRGGEAIARCTAVVDQQLVAQRGEALGGIGFFESQPEPDAARALLAAACEWLSAEGMRRVWAPMDLSIWCRHRVKTAGFDLPGLPGDPDNPAYTADLLEGAGFEALQHWTASWLDQEAMARVAQQRKPHHDTCLAEGQVVLRSVDPKLGEEEIARLHGLLVPNLCDSTGWTPLLLDEFRFLRAADLAHADPDLAAVAQTPRGEPLGLLLARPDPSETLRAMAGKSGWRARVAGWRAGGKGPRRLLVQALALRPLARHQGLGSALLHRVLLAALLKGYREAFLGPVPIGNPAARYSRDYVEAGPRYALYGRSL